MKVRGLYIKNGVYWFQPSGAKLPGGSPYPRPFSLKTKDYDEALQAVTRVRHEGGDTPGEMLGTLIDPYLAAKAAAGKHRPFTQTCGRGVLKKLLADLGNVRVDSIDRKTAQAWLDSLRTAKRTEITIGYYLRFTRPFFNWLIETGRLRENPFSKITLRVSRQSKRDKFCTREQRTKLLNACDRDDLRFVLMCGFFLGLRIKEIVNARWGWFTIIGEDQGMVTVRNDEEFRTKSGHERVIPMPAEFYQYFKKLKAGEADAYVVHPDVVQGKSAYRWHPHLPFRHLTKRCDLQWVGFHTMRHTFGSLLAIAGVPEIKIRRWMGITQPVFERHYAGLSPNDREIDKL